METCPRWLYPLLWPLTIDAASKMCMIDNVSDVTTRVKAPSPSSQQMLTRERVTCNVCVGLVLLLLLCCLFGSWALEQRMLRLCLAWAFDDMLKPNRAFRLKIMRIDARMCIQIGITSDVCSIKYPLIHICRHISWEKNQILNPAMLNFYNGETGHQGKANKRWYISQNYQISLFCLRRI